MQPVETTEAAADPFFRKVVSIATGLSFGGIPERLVVPFSSIKSFFDPSVQFGLQFEPPEPRAKEPEPEPEARQTAATDDAPKVVSLDQFRKK